MEGCQCVCLVFHLFSISRHHYDESVCVHSKWMRSRCFFFTLCLFCLHCEPPFFVIPLECDEKRDLFLCYRDASISVVPSTCCVCMPDSENYHMRHTLCTQKWVWVMLEMMLLRMQIIFCEAAFHLCAVFLFYRSVVGFRFVWFCFNSLPSCTAVYEYLL